MAKHVDVGSKVKSGQRIYGWGDAAALALLVNFITMYDLGTELGVYLSWAGEAQRRAQEDPNDIEAMSHLPAWPQDPRNPQPQPKEKRERWDD